MQHGHEQRGLSCRYGAGTKRSVENTRRELFAVEASARRVTGRRTRKTASAPIHRLSGTKKVAIA